MRYTDCKEENWELTLEKCLGEKRKGDDLVLEFAFKKHEH